MSAANRLKIIEARFLTRIDKTSSPKGCWLFIGAKQPSGRGKVKIRMPDGSLEWHAHRLAFILWHGPIPDGKSVLHTEYCNTPACVMPEHLYAGTQRDNVYNAINLGNLFLVSRHARLSDLRVRVIRALFRRGTAKMIIAEKLNLPPRAVSDVLKRRRRKNVRW